MILRHEDLFKVNTEESHKETESSKLETKLEYFPKCKNSFAYKHSAGRNFYKLSSGLFGRIILNSDKSWTSLKILISRFIKKLGISDFI